MRIEGFTRREFGQLALAGIPLALTARLDAAGVRIGVQSYSFRTMSLADAIAAMKTDRADGVRAVCGPRGAEGAAAARRRAAAAGSASGGRTGRAGTSTGRLPSRSGLA